jgi:hypothetical protein
MHRIDRRLYLLFGTLAIVLACTCAPLSKLGIPSINSPLSPADDFPHTPDPIAITVVLDTANAATNANWAQTGVADNFSVDGQTADGIPFSLSMPGALLSQDADGNLSAAFGSPVTVTPILSIDGLPFSQGYLAAFQIAPEGALMVTPGYLSLQLPGLLDVSQVIGFAADGNGQDFHLFPVTVNPDDYNGLTWVSFNIPHFSIYGIALATVQEVEAQAGHPPANPASQDDQDLAPLYPIMGDPDLTPLPNIVQLQLDKSYDRLVRNSLDNLADIPCNKVDVAAYQFEAWMSKVSTANQTDHYQSRINQDAASLLARLTACARVTCESCVNNTTGAKLNQAAVNTLFVQAAFAGDMASILGDSEQWVFWYQVSNKCAEEADLPLIGFMTGGDYAGPAQTAVPLICK